MKKISLLAGRLLTLLLVVGSLGLLNGCKNNNDDTTVYGDWTKGSSFAGVARSGSATFTINNIAYVATGIDQNSNRYNDLWSFNPATGSWTQLKDFPGVARYNAVAFSAGGKGYVGTGYDGTNYLGDFYEYTPSTNTWRKVADLPAVGSIAGRTGAVAGSINDLGYVGCGYNGNYLKDFYRYTPSTTAAGLGTWSTFAGFPGDKRQGGVAFTISNQLYVGTGTNNGTNATDFWSYDPQNDRWTQHRYLANISNSTESYDYSAVARVNAVAFVVNNLGFVATGASVNAGSVRTDCYVYDPLADTWTLKNPFPSTFAGRTGGVAFGIGDFGYVGLGNSGSTRFDDFWKFAPDAAQE
jgi:N-acetylneuraminic acid mutarotase